jgi:alpha-beta hydrolase superfamily lysophospholipase
MKEMKLFTKVKHFISIDIQEISNSVKVEGVPLFLMGHSMGG